MFESFSLESMLEMLRWFLHADEHTVLLNTYLHEGVFLLSALYDSLLNYAHPCQITALRDLPEDILMNAAEDIKNVNSKTKVSNTEKLLSLLTKHFSILNGFLVNLHLTSC